MAEENNRIEEYPTPVLQALANAKNFPNPHQLPDLVEEAMREEKNKKLAELRGTPKNASRTRTEEKTWPIGERPPHIPLDHEEFIRDTHEVDVELDDDGSLDDLDPSMDEDEEGEEEI